MQIWRKLHTHEGVYDIFLNKKYGNTFEELKGKGKSYGEAYAKQKLEQALVDNIYVKSVDNVSLKLEKSLYTISFTINTIYGNTDEKLNIPLED
jgi:hypothetical protein